MNEIEDYNLMEYLKQGKAIYNNYFNYVKRDNRGNYIDIIGNLIDLNDKAIWQYRWFAIDENDKERLDSVRFEMLIKSIKILTEKVDYLTKHFTRI